MSLYVQEVIQIEACPLRRAIGGDGEHIIKLDAVMDTMRPTSEDMRVTHAEKGPGDLAVNALPVILVERWSSDDLIPA